MYFSRVSSSFLLASYASMLEIDYFFRFVSNLQVSYTRTHFHLQVFDPLRSPSKARYGEERLDETRRVGVVSGSEPLYTDFYASHASSMSQYNVTIVADQIIRTQSRTPFK